MNTVHPEDSLDNLSNLQINRQKQLIIQVKQQFNRGLEKLQMTETREIGISELKKLIEHYREQEYLRGYLAILKTLKSNSNSATKEHQILVVSILAQTYKDQLLDPLDKPPSLLKSAFRLVEILHSYFNDHSPTVQQACARALLDVNTHCLSRQTTEAVYSITYAPLISILKSGVEKGSQATASACLSELIKFNRKTGADELLKRLSPELLSAILKVGAEYHQLFQAVFGMIESQGLSFLEGKLVTFLAKIVAVIDGTRQMQNTNTTNLNAYMCKVNICKIIEKIGRLLPQSEKQKLFELRIPEALQQAARHRIIQVQLAASKALKAWKGEQIEEEDSLPRARGLMNLEEKRNSKKAERSRSKEERAKAESQLTFMKEDLEKMVKGGWGANNRAKNYIKRGTGVGGGHISRSELSPQSKSGGKSHKEHLDELRQFIKKGAEENRNIDRFVGLIGTEVEKINHSSPKLKQRSKSPPPRGKSPEMQSLSLRGKSQGSQQKKGKSVSRPDEQDGEFDLVQDEGDQMVYIPNPVETRKPSTKFQEQKKNVQNHKSRFEDVGMTESEAMELMAQQKALLQEGKRMNINFTEISGQDQHPKQETKKNQIQGTTSLVERLPLKEAYNMYTPQQPEKNPKKGEQTIQQEIFPTFKGISHEEVGDLVEQYNLSQVSSNLNDVLTESDLKAFKSSKVEMIDSNILEPTEGKSDINALKEIVADKKQKKSAVNKFFKKQFLPQPGPEVGVKQDIKIQSQKQEEKSLKQNLDQPAVSLNFTESQQSRLKSAARREEIQFTLNPKERFSNVKEQKNGNEKEIEEEIAMSQYEETFPRDQPLPIILPKIAPITQIPLRYSLSPEEMEKQIKKSPQKEISKKEKLSPPPTFSLKDQIQQQPPETKVIYQNLIKNPPKLNPQNDPSRLKASKVTEKSYPEKSRMSHDFDDGDNIGKSWLEVLDKLEEGQLNQAYEGVLQLDDPIYFLRLMLLSKTPVKKLSPDTFQKVWKKFMEIYSQKFIDVLTVGLLSESHDLGILSKCLSVQELQSAMVGLYQLSGSSRGKLSYKAANLYNQIDSKLHGE